MTTPNADSVLCRKCGQPIEGDGFGSPETGHEHPFTCPPSADSVRITLTIPTADDESADHLAVLLVKEMRRVGHDATAFVHESDPAQIDGSV